MTRCAAPWIGFASMAMPIKFGIVAALEREVRPLLRCSVRMRTTADTVFHEFPAAVIVCGGIGAERAREAAEALIAAYHPTILVSAGFAGAVEPKLKPGDVFMASTVLDVASGRSFRTQQGNGVLATARMIAGQQQKAELAKIGAAAVDMEASAVAQVAAQHGSAFLAIKGISDEFNFPMPAMERFVSAAGKFQTAQFITHVALRPHRWLTVKRLAANCARAANALSDALDTLLAAGSVTKTESGDTVRLDSV
jgi:adenosylhomocysteine nucleosidase